MNPSHPTASSSKKGISRSETRSGALDFNMPNTPDMPSNASPFKSPAPKKSLTGHRVMVGVALGLLTIALILLGSWFWTAAVLFTLYQGLKELSTIYRAKQIYPSQTVVLTIGVLWILLAHFGKTHYILPVMAFGIVAAFIRLLFRRPMATLNDMGATLLSIFYVAFLPIHYILLRNLSDSSLLASGFSALFSPGVYYVFFTVVVIAASDVGAYYFGRRFGQNPLYPEISPKKTREGALGGLFLGLLLGGGGFLLAPGFTLGHALTLSLLLIITSQLGDLTESMMKRDAGIKDSGGMLLGHGGLLDRLDSYLFCGVLSYYYIHWVILQQGLAQEFIPF